jgi:plexin A
MIKLRKQFACNKSRRHWTKTRNALLLLALTLLVCGTVADENFTEDIDYSEFYASSGGGGGSGPALSASSSLNSNKINSNIEQYLSRKLNFNELNPSATLAVKSAASYVSDSTLAKKPPRFTNINSMLYYRGYLYVGAQNWLLKINANTLEVEQSVQYGPVADSSNCRYVTALKEECLLNGQAKKQLVPNYNKVLLIHEREQRLLSCWSVKQGVCDLRDLDNITHVVQESMQAAVGNDAVNSTVGFIATSSNSQDLFYVANTYTSVGPYRDEVPALAGRSLSPLAPRFMEVIQSKGQGLKSSQASIEFISRFRKSFIVNYVHGFSAGIFNYFLTVQHVDTDSMHRTLQTKLARFCLNDLSFVKSYVEVPLECIGNKRAPGNRNGHSKLHYNELVSAKVVTLKGERYIAGLFQQTTRSTFNASVSEAGLKQGMCLFPLKHVQASIRDNVRQCHYNMAELMRGLNFIKPDQKCTSKSKSGFISDSDVDEQTTASAGEEDFCSLADNNGLYPIGGRLPVQAMAILEFESTAQKPITFDTLQVAVINENVGQSGAEETAIDGEEFDVILLSSKYNEMQMFNIKSLNSIPILYRYVFNNIIT